MKDAVRREGHGPQGGAGIDGAVDGNRLAGHCGDVNGAVGGVGNAARAIAGDHTGAHHGFGGVVQDTARTAEGHIRHIVVGVEAGLAVGNTDVHIPQGFDLEGARGRDAAGQVALHVRVVLQAACDGGDVGLHVHTTAGDQHVTRAATGLLLDGGVSAIGLFGGEHAARQQRHQFAATAEQHIVVERHVARGANRHIARGRERAARVDDHVAETQSHQVAAAAAQREGARFDALAGVKSVGGGVFVNAQVCHITHTIACAGQCMFGAAEDFQISAVGADGGGARTKIPTVTRCGFERAGRQTVEHRRSRLGVGVITQIRSVKLPRHVQGVVGRIGWITVIVGCLTRIHRGIGNQLHRSGGKAGREPSAVVLCIGAGPQ